MAKGLKPEDYDRFYEVILDDCDGLRAILHVWKSGRVHRHSGTPYAVKKLLPLWHDEEAPAWVLTALIKMSPSLARPHHAGVVTDDSAAAGVRGKIPELLPDVVGQRGVVEGGLSEQ